MRDETGTSAPYTNRQNLSFEWDLNGNLKKRIDGNQSNLTEEFFYDALNRFDYSTLNGATNLDLALDAIGNITAKTSSTDPAENVGAYTYHATKKHAVISTSNGWSFGYDANGNMNSYKGNSIAWYSYNLPSTINGAGQSSQFWYGPNRNRWKQVATYPSGSETTIYVGGILEKVTVPTGTGYRHYVGAGSAKVVYTRWSSGSESTKYVTTDHLNSSTVVMDSAGASLVNLSFAAFGARRGAAWSGTPSSGDWTQINNATRQGYTGHEHLDNINIVHMNGRVFEPVLGRFLSADPFMPGALGSQGPNRYAYIANRPLSAIDPSGYWPRVGNALKAWRSDPSNADTISPWEEAAYMNAQARWHQMNPRGGLVNGLPVMQTMTGMEWADRYLLAGFRGASNGPILTASQPHHFGSNASVNIDCSGATGIICEQEPDRWSAANDARQQIDDMQARLHEFERFLLSSAGMAEFINRTLPSGEYSLSSQEARRLAANLKGILHHASIALTGVVVVGHMINGEWIDAGTTLVDTAIAAALFNVPGIGPVLSLLYLETEGSALVVRGVVYGAHYVD